jgi:hypothetical protein
MKAIPASAIEVLTYSWYPPITEYYLKRKFQGTPIYHEDMVIATTLPNGDGGWLAFPIVGMGWRKEDHKDFGGVVMVTPETSFKVEMSTEKRNGQGPDRGIWTPPQSRR